MCKNHEWCKDDAEKNQDPALMCVRLLLEHEKRVREATGKCDIKSLGLVARLG